jgi:conjugative relaxase-like TrwC/TraI family protein
MLIVRPIGAEVGRYYLDGRDPGRWTPGAHALLGLAGPVGEAELRRVLSGRHPATGRFLPERKPPRRRAGWDLVFAAPKSASLVEALGHPAVARAHMAAVDAVVAYLEGRLHMKIGIAAGSPLRAEGLIGAAFEHRSNAAGEPHRHTHVLVANLSRSGDRWGAILRNDWVIDRRAIDALYQLELRHQMVVHEVDLEWRMGDDGQADLAQIPRAAVRAASTQTRLARRDGRFAARASAQPQPWRRAVVAAGYREPTRGVGPAAGLDDSRLPTAVAARLTARRSDFRAADAVVALSETFPGGATTDQVHRWAERFCAGSIQVPSPTSAPRWTTAAARDLDRQLRDALLERGAVRIVGGPAGTCPLLSQAEYIEQLAAGWADGNRRVAVDSPEAERWRLLTGIGADADRADILIVDAADRRTTPSMLRTVRRHGGELVLVEGGTRPRLTNPVSHGLRDAADALGRIDLPAHLPWRIADVGRERDGPEPVGRVMAGRLLGEWQARGRRELLVGLGLEEVRALNRAAAGPDRNPDDFLPGDRVVVIRGGAGLPRYGSLGTVVDERPLRLAWDDGTVSEVAPPGGRARPRLGHGWAVTAPTAARTDRLLMVLGPARSLGFAAGRVVGEVDRAVIDGAMRDRRSALVPTRPAPERGLGL